MHTLARTFVAVLVVACGSALQAQPTALTVTISDMHLCCKGCTAAVEKSVAKIPGVKCTASKEDRTTLLTASNPKVLQEALDAIAAAGFYGTVDNNEVEFKPIAFKEGNVQKLEVAHIHNCCMACTDAIKAAIEPITGVKSNTLKNKKTSFVVEGDFSPDEVVKAIQAAGFYPTLKTDEAKKK